MSALEKLLKDIAKEDKYYLPRFVDLVIKNSSDKRLIALAQEIMGSVQINLSELESLINPDKFNFPDYEVGLVGIKKDDNEVI
jgi:hypothetical protein